MAVPIDGGWNGEVYDIIAVGFGPSNLALATSVHEHNAAVPAQERLTARFFERQPAFGWHRGMLLDDATMQLYRRVYRERVAGKQRLHIHHLSRVVDVTDYRVATGENVHCGIYLQGGTEHSHGISASLPSTAAVRAGEIVASVASRLAAARCQSTVPGEAA